MLVRHYSRVRDETRRSRGALEKTISADYLDRMDLGLGYWIEWRAGASELGIDAFQKEQLIIDALHWMKALSILQYPCVMVVQAGAPDLQFPFVQEVEVVLTVLRSSSRTLYPVLLVRASSHLAPPQWRC